MVLEFFPFDQVLGADQHADWVRAQGVFFKSSAQGPQGWCGVTDTCVSWGCSCEEFKP
jgi:hypothetical protein